MTIIAFKDGILAGDSNITTGGVIVGAGKKVLKTDEGFLIGGAGSYGTLQMFFNWFEDDEEDKPSLAELKLEDFEGIIVHPDGEFIILDPTGYPMEIKADYFALGSGSSVALGAMAAGATAVEAVKHAIKLVPSCGGKVQSVKL